MAPQANGAKQRLMSELAALQKEKWLHIDAENLFCWRIAIAVINPDSDFKGGCFAGHMTFPPDYPYAPPSFTFTTPLFHPNVYRDGRLCISILHSPGDDAMSGEQAGERWTPLQGVESVLLSTLLLLDHPEIGSPANVDAGVLYRDQREAYRARAAAAVARSRQELPAGFVMPEAPKVDGDDNDKAKAAAAAAAARSAKDEAAFWLESDEEEVSFSDSEDEDQEFVDEEAVESDGVA